MVSVWTLTAGGRTGVSGELATCDMVRLELLHSARSATELAEIREELAALPD
jgi:predicted nucleic acid-binding protein